MIYLRLLWSIFTFVVYQLAVIPLWILGWPLMWMLGIPLAHVEKSPITGMPIINPPRWMWLWGNDEDGLDPDWYKEANPTWGPLRRMMVWSCWRNSVNNLRCVKWLHPAPVAEKIQVHYWGENWLCWQGVFAQLRVRLGKYVFNCGWRYYPYDRNGVDPADWRCWGTGFRWSVLKGDDLP